MRLFYLLVIISCFSLVVKAINLDQFNSSVFFPQNIGDERVYRKVGKMAKPNDSWTDKVTEKKGKIFSHSNFWGDDVRRELKMNNRHQIIEKAKDKKYIWYKLDETSEWTMNLSQEGIACTEGAKIKITSRSETVQVPAGTFQNCLKLEFTSNCNDAGVEAQWFAPNVGLVKQTESTFAGILTTELVKATISGKNYPEK
ncbi:MAG: hypothetical protein HY819_05365 [Acidobacteria bacterium]|nr:hypothetical protein [Acidobacteriota bacterium]